MAKKSNSNNQNGVQVKSKPHTDDDTADLLPLLPEGCEYVTVRIPVYVGKVSTQQHHEKRVLPTTRLLTTRQREAAYRLNLANQMIMRQISSSRPALMADVVRDLLEEVCERVCETRE